MKIDITVTRSCYSLGESNVEVATFSGLAPGETVTFTDTAEPAWKYGQQYTYTPVASIDGRKGAQGYGSLTPGLDFSFGYGDVKALSELPASGEKATVDVQVTVPSKLNSPIVDIPVEMTALEFYRVTDPKAWPYPTEYMGSIENPQKGETYIYKDSDPIQNAENYYVVKCISPFGYAETSAHVYVGYDTPSAPYPVKAEAVDGGVYIYWTAPDSGENYGEIDPADTYYIVSRCWGQGADEREVIADNLTATEYTDYGTDMEFPRAVRYEVTAANSVGVGGSEFTGYSYDFLVGPAEKMPFVEDFNGGMTHVWSTSYSSYYCQFSLATEAEFSLGSEDVTVAPHSGRGLIYIDYAASRGNAQNDLTSYKIEVPAGGADVLSFWYFALPSTDITITPQLSRDGGEFESLGKVNITTPGQEGMQWLQASFPLEDMEGVKDVVVRLRFDAPTSYAAAVIDDIALLNYASVGQLAVEYDVDACTAIISWADPSGEYTRATGFEGYVDGVSVGEVASPWVFQAAEHRKNYVVAVKALYEGVEVPVSPTLTVNVPRPEYTEFTVADHVFTIVTDEEGARSVIIKAYTGNDALYRTPEMVNYDDISYEVIGIGAGAYEGNTSMVSLTVTEDIASIGDAAFKGCESLAAASLGGGLTSIGAEAFKGCGALKTVIFASYVPPVVGRDAFAGIDPEAKGSCPADSERDYAAVEELAPLHFATSGISLVGAASGLENVEYYDAAGRRVIAPEHGKIVIVMGIDAAGKRVSRRCMMR